MKPYRKTTRPEVSRRKKTSLKREFRYCKRAKGPHQYELTVPNIATELIQQGEYKSIKAYYEYWDKHSQFGTGLRWWKCVFCGHKDFDSERHPSKHIRDSIKPL